MAQIAIGISILELNEERLKNILSLLFREQFCFKKGYIYSDVKEDSYNIYEFPNIIPKTYNSIIYS